MEAVVTETRTKSDAGISFDLPKFNLVNSLKRIIDNINEKYDDFMLVRAMNKAMKEPGSVSRDEIMEILGQ
jgi:hypothetical protein